jgi:hypothetical protein
MTHGGWALEAREGRVLCECLNQVTQRGVLIARIAKYRCLRCEYVSATVDLDPSQDQ